MHAFHLKNNNNNNNLYLFIVAYLFGIQQSLLNWNDFFIHCWFIYLLFLFFDNKPKDKTILKQEKIALVCGKIQSEWIGKKADMNIIKNVIIIIIIIQEDTQLI